MNSLTTVLGILRQARDLVSTGQHLGIIEAISSLQDDASGPIRDLAYYALLETVAMGKGSACLSMLASPNGQEITVELFDATIKRIASKLH
jgi:hypothetical protein